MVTGPRTLAQVSEAALLAEIFPYFAAHDGLLVGPGDDAAVLVTGGSVVATTDAMVRGRDWVDEWSSASDVATTRPDLVVLSPGPGDPSRMEPQIATRDKAQAWLRFKGYEPTTLRIGPLQRLGGRMTSANVAFDDHPSELRFSDRIETVTVDSVFAWLQRAQMGGAPVVLSLGASY